MRKRRPRKRQTATEVAATRRAVNQAAVQVKAGRSFAMRSRGTEAPFFFRRDSDERRSVGDDGFAEGIDDGTDGEDGYAVAADGEDDG